MFNKIFINDFPINKLLKKEQYVYILYVSETIMANSHFAESGPEIRLFCLLYPLDTLV